MNQNIPSLPDSNILYHAPGKEFPVIDRIVRGVAGTFILLSLLLAHVHHPGWLYFTAFVGLNLLQSAITNWCPLITILRKMGFSQ